MIKIKSYYAKTDQGPYLIVNEDDHKVDITSGLYMIFDGFGGTGIGDRVVKEVKSNIQSFYMNIGNDSEATFPFYFSHKYLIEGNALINAMEFAHKIVNIDNASKDMDSRGGTSTICCALAENIMTFAQVGNCSAYILRRGKLLNILSPDCLQTVAMDNFISQFHFAPTSGIGLFEKLHLNIQEHRIIEGDLIVLLTDGVYARIDFIEITHILSNIDNSLEDKGQKMFDLSNFRGNRDNQTTVLLQF